MQYMYYGTIRGPKYEIVPIEGNITIIVRFLKHITTKHRPHMEYRILEDMVLLAHPPAVIELELGLSNVPAKKIS